jgi:hypothetical protein
MRRKTSGQGGPVRRITDPNELAQLAERYAKKADHERTTTEPIQRTGNSITLCIGDKERVLW